jgi:hypothetical protein
MVGHLPDRAAVVHAHVAGRFSCCTRVQQCCKTASQKTSSKGQTTVVATCHIGVVLFVTPVHVQPKRRHAGSWCSKMPSRRPAHRCAAFQNG